MASRDSVAHRSTRAERSETSHTATGDLTHRRRRRSALRGPLRPLASVELVLLRPHLLHELLVGRGQDDLVELSAVIRDEADALDDDVVDEPLVAALERPVVHRDVAAFLGGELGAHGRLVAVDRLPHIGDLLAAVGLDPGDVGPLQKVGEQLDELLALRRRPLGPMARQRAPRGLAEVEGRLDLSDPATGRDDLLGPARADAHVLLPDQPLRLDRRDRVLLQLDPSTDPEGHERLVVLQADVLDAPDLDARDLHRRAGLQPADRRELGEDRIATAAEERNASEFNGKIPQCQEAEQQEQSHGDVDAPSLHQVSSAPSGSPRMNRRTTGFVEAWMTAGGPTSAIRPSCSMATVSAISKISGIS